LNRKIKAVFHLAFEKRSVWQTDNGLTSVPTVSTLKFDFDKGASSSCTVKLGFPCSLFRLGSGAGRGQKRKLALISMNRLISVDFESLQL
jgi:hypothetical protein